MDRIFEFLNSQFFALAALRSVLTPSGRGPSFPNSSILFF